MNQFDEQLAVICFQPDEEWQHVLILDDAICQKCRAKQCLTFCPSGVFKESTDAKQPLMVLYKQCVECGGCRLICDNIDFSYPRGGYGVTFLEG